jgi:hypothetical protein
MKMDNLPIETTADDTFYDIAVKGLKTASEKQSGIERIVLTSKTGFKPTDPHEIFLHSSFRNGKPKFLSASMYYEDKISTNTLTNLLISIPDKRYEIDARQSIKGWTLEKLQSEKPAYVKIEAPFNLGFVDVSLPEKANWIDAAQIRELFDSLGIRYAQKEYLAIKPFKWRTTHFGNLVSAYEFFTNRNFNTKLEVKTFSLSASIENKEDGHRLHYSLHSFFGLSKSFADSVQWLFEKHLSFNGNGRQYFLEQSMIESKNKGMKIDYD